MERVGPLYEDVDRQEAHAKKQVGSAALVPARCRWTRASFRSLSRVNLVSPPKPRGRSPRRRGLEGAGRLRVAAGKRQFSPAFPIPPSAPGPVRLRDGRAGRARGTAHPALPALPGAQRLTNSKTKSRSGKVVKTAEPLGSRRPPEAVPVAMQARGCPPRNQRRAPLAPR